MVADCGDCASAVDVVRRLAPHLVLLDVEMPRCDSFQVLEALDRRARPFVVFLAADSAHAARAFEVRALDYLIKPPHPNRLRAALDRARREIDTLDARNPSDSLPAPGKGRADQVDRLLVKTRGRIVFLPIDEIDWVEAAGNYVVVHAGSRSLMLRSTIHAIERRLDARAFLRVHRSTIVNLGRIRELQPQVTGEYRVVLHTGATLTLTSRQTSAARARLTADMKPHRCRGQSLSGHLRGLAQHARRANRPDGARARARNRDRRRFPGAGQP